MRTKIVLGALAALLGVAMASGGVSAASADTVTPDGTQSTAITCDPNGWTGDTAVTGVPNCNFWRVVQNSMARLGGYTGPLDGLMGTGSWKGVQTYLNASYPPASLVVDGVPGTNTIKAVQRWLNFGYGLDGSGAQIAVDGVLGTQTYRAWGYWGLAASD